MEITSQFTIPASGATKDFVLNHKRGSEFSVGVALNLTAGTTPNVQVQITLDDIQDDSVTPFYVDIGTPVTAVGTSVVHVIEPCTAVRVNTTAGTGVAGTFSIVQAS